MSICLIHWGFIFCRSFVLCFICTIAVAAFGQDEALRSSTDNAEAFVIAPVDQSMADKRSLLRRIEPVTGRVQKAPNVLLMLADDLGYADTAVYGSQSIPTPHIDALADAGVRFTESYVIRWMYLLLQVLPVTSIVFSSKRCKLPDNLSRPRIFTKPENRVRSGAGLKSAKHS